MLISVEGLDGVGKSSLVKNLSEELNYQVIEKPIRKLLNITDDKSNQITEVIYKDYSCNIQAMYYLLGYLSAMEDGKKGNYVLDRGPISTYYFSHCDENAALFDFFANNYGFPDLTIVLYASVEKRISRISSRSTDDEDLKKSRLYKDGYPKVFEALKKYGVSYLLVHTENLNQSEVLDISIRLINLWSKNDVTRKEICKIFSIENIEVLKKCYYCDILEMIDKADKKINGESRKKE